VGDAVNVASRLEHSAETGQVLVAERTARASRGLHLREVGRLALKGKEDPVRAFELLESEEIPQPGNLLRGRTMDASPTGPDVALGRISEAVGGLLHEAGTGAAEAESTVGALAFTLGLQDPARPFEGYSPQQVRVEAHEAWRAYFSALARRSPTVVVIEDLH